MGRRFHASRSYVRGDDVSLLHDRLGQVDGLEVSHDQERAALVRIEAGRASLAVVEARTSRVLRLASIPLRPTPEVDSWWVGWADATTLGYRVWNEEIGGSDKDDHRSRHLQPERLAVVKSSALRPSGPSRRVDKPVNPRQWITRRPGG